MQGAPLRARDVAVSCATLACYVGLVVWLTWPLAAHLGTHLPSVSTVAEMDTLHSLWVLSWETHALATDPAHFLDANIYHPARDALLYSTMGLATLPYFAPTFLLTGNPVLAANLAFLGCIALAAWGLHRVTWWWTGSATAGVIAACAFLGTPWVLWSWTPARPIHVALHYFPWIIALLALPGWSVRRCALLLPLVVLQCVVDPIYVAPAVVLPIAIVALARLRRPATRAAGVSLAATVALAAVVLSPIYIGYAAMRSANPSLFHQSAWAKRDGASAADPVDGLILAGGTWADLRPTGVPWVVVPLIGLGLLSFVRRRRDERAHDRASWMHAGLWVVVGLLISTRALVWLSDPPVVVPSPLFLLVDWLAPDIATTLRGTVRLGIAALPGLALLAGVAFSECERRVPTQRRAAAPLVAVMVIAAMYARWPGRDGPYPITAAPASETPIIAALRQSSGPVLELPAGTGPYATVRHARAMYRSIFHWRPLLNGYGSYWPEGFPERMELAAKLPDAGAWAALRRETGVDAIVVHPNAPRYAAWLVEAGRPDGPLVLVARDGGDLLFSAR